MTDKEWNEKCARIAHEIFKKNPPPANIPQDRWHQIPVVEAVDDEENNKKINHQKNK